MFLQRILGFKEGGSESKKLQCVFPFSCCLFLPQNPAQFLFEGVRFLGETHGLGERNPLHLPSLRSPETADV